MQKLKDQHVKNITIKLFPVTTNKIYWVTYSFIAFPQYKVSY